MLETGLFEDEVDHGRGVFGAHVFPFELPEVERFDVEGLVSLTESVATVVPEPDIVAGSREDECWRLFGLIEYPLHHVGLQAVLKEDWGLLRSVTLVESARDSPDAEDVAVRGVYLIALDLEAVLLGELLHTFEGVGALELAASILLLQIIQDTRVIP